MINLRHNHNTSPVAGYKYLYFRKKNITKRLLWTLFYVNTVDGTPKLSAYFAYALASLITGFSVPL